MNVKEKLNSINAEIQSFRLDNYNGLSDSLIAKLEELKGTMVMAYENNRGLNKYAIRLPMWLIDMTLQDYKRHRDDKDGQLKITLVENIKNISAKAVELFDKAFVQESASPALA